MTKKELSINVRMSSKRKKKAKQEEIPGWGEIFRLGLIVLGIPTFCVVAFVSGIFCLLTDNLASGLLCWAAAVFGAASLKTFSLPTEL